MNSLHIRQHLSKRGRWVRTCLLAVIFILLLVIGSLSHRYQNKKNLLEHQVRVQYMRVFVGFHSGLSKALIEDDKSFSLYWYSFDDARRQRATANATNSSLSLMFPGHQDHTIDTLFTVTESISGDVWMAFQFPPSPLNQDEKEDYQIMVSFLEEELMNTPLNTNEDYVTKERCDDFLQKFAEVVTQTKSPDFQQSRKALSHITFSTDARKD